MSSVRPVLFVNFTDQPFSAIPYEWPVGSETQMVDEHCKWGGVADSFAPHASRYMEQWRAEHFAKHLLDRELNKLKKPTDDVKLRKEMLEKCIIEKGEEVISENIEMELMNKNIKPTTEAPAKKKGRPAKVVEPEFPDLKG